MNLNERFQQAVQSYWDVLRIQQQKQITLGIRDAGRRSAVTGGGQMNALESLVAEIIRNTGLQNLEIHTGSELEIPGYFRAEKKWDLLAVSNGRLVCALEFKSQVGPSFGNNFNNRTEEAVGNAVDIWTAFREGRFQGAPRPFVGYFFLLEDCEKVHKAVAMMEPHFKADGVFREASYAKRYEILCRRLVLERYYDAACLTLASNDTPTRVSHPLPDLDFTRWVSELCAGIARFKD